MRVVTRRRLGAIVLAAAAAAAAAGVPAAASASASTASPVVGYTYVNDNTAAANTIAGFARHADGSLTPIPGSPFAAGGAALVLGWPRRARSR